MKLCKSSRAKQVKYAAALPESRGREYCTLRAESLGLSNPPACSSAHFRAPLPPALQPRAPLPSVQRCWQHSRDLGLSPIPTCSSEIRAPLPPTCVEMLALAMPKAEAIVKKMPPIRLVIPVISARLATRNASSAIG